MGNRKIIKERLKKKKKRSFSNVSKVNSTEGQDNEKFKIKKYSLNLLHKLSDTFRLPKKRKSSLGDGDESSESSTNLSVTQQKEDKSSMQNLSINESDISRKSSISNTKNEPNNRSNSISEMYLVGNESEYKRQMKNYINNLTPCSNENLSLHKWLSMAAKIFILLEKYFTSINTVNIFNFDSAFLKLFPVDVIQSIVHKVISIISEEPILLELSTTPKDIVVVSDIHGSILDLIKVLMDNGFPDSKNYLFLGNYVDKGTEDVVVITLIFLLKICYPKNVYLLRGNHEFLDQNSKQCFPIRCKAIFGSYNVYRIFNYGFEFLPLAAIVDNDILCVHGGVSQWMTCRNSISSILRPLTENKDIISRAIITDIVWADAYRGDYESSDSLGFTLSKRGIGFAFNEYGLKKILEALKVIRLIRGHQPYEEGYKVEYDNSCYTIHLRNLFEYYNSHGSYCVLKNIPNNRSLMKSNIYIDLRKYSLITQIPTNTTAATLCRHLASELKKTLEKISVKEYSNAGKPCPHCFDKTLYLKLLTTKKRTFVIHDQIKELITSDRLSKTKQKNYQIFNVYLKSDNAVPIERFPIFLDLIYNKQVRDPQLISPDEMQLANKVREDLRAVQFQLNTLTFFAYSNLPLLYYNSVADISKDRDLKCEVRAVDLYYKKTKFTNNDGQNNNK
uniref:Serine/threonine-protein phosphatase n=1 Tax=Strongyloides venezuelensis TaxID=75913 RepID=A0A0K0F094_STRVS